MDSGTSSAIIGAVVGGAISLASTVGVQEWTRYRSDKRERVKQRQLVDNVRLLLHLEMQRNLDALARVWSRVTLNVVGGPDQMELMRLMRFVGEPLPMWATLIWERQIEHLAIALTPDVIMRATDIQDKLGLLREYHASMVRELPDDLVFHFDGWVANPERPPIERYEPLGVGGMAYLQRQVTLWQQCKGIMNELAQLQSGNPIPWSKGKE